MVFGDLKIRKVTQFQENVNINLNFVPLFVVVKQNENKTLWRLQTNKAKTTTHTTTSSRSTTITSATTTRILNKVCQSSEI